LDGPKPEESRKPRGFWTKAATIICLFLAAIFAGAGLGHLIWPEDPYFAQIYSWLLFIGKLLSYANLR